MRDGVEDDDQSPIRLSRGDGRCGFSFALSIVDCEFEGDTQKEVVNFVPENGGVKPGYARQIYRRVSLTQKTT
jgi:hypothetical protein